MSFQATIITIFISSPGDVPDDRNMIVRTINGWNQRNGQSRGVFFQPLTWEQMVAPDRSGSGQEVIDSQIGTSYDIYLGLMWSRFGSATTKADSGTEDEFNQAVVRHDSGEGLTISFLFKNSAIPQDILDGIQFDKVQKFKKKVGEKGCLYREYNDDASLIDAVNLILDRFANTSSGSGPSSPKGGTRPDPPAQSHANECGVQKAKSHDDELGLIDLNEILEAEGDRFTKLMGEWSSRLGKLGEIAGQATDELNSISRFGQIEPKAARKIINRIANQTDSIVDWGEEKQFLIEECMEKFSEAFFGLTSISNDFHNSKEEIETGINVGEELIKTIHETNDSLEGLARTALAVPRITKEMIKSNKRLATYLKQMIEKNRTFAVNIGICVDELRNISPNNS